MTSTSVNEEIATLLRSDLRIRRLSIVKSWPYILAAIFDWSIIVLSAFAAKSIANPLIYILSCLAIAGRQHAFFALSHEAAHYRISTNRLWNDVFSNCFFAYPVLFDTDAYRQNHLKHHKFLNSEMDPDWVRKIQLPQWQFPMSLSYIWKTYPKFLFWNGPKEWILIMLQLARVLPLRDIFKPESLQRVSIRVTYYALLAVPMTYFSLWGDFIKFWAIPLVLVFPTVQRVRSVAEHFGLARTHDLNQTRNVMAPWYERFLFGPHNINYHLDHHLIASVPFYNLPALHKILLENETFRRWGHENSSYLVPSMRSLQKDLFRKPQSVPESEKMAA